MLRRLATAVAAILVVCPAAITISGCGSGNGQLQVSVTGEATRYAAGDPTTFASYKPGDQATFTLRVVNTGPGSVSGVTVHVTLPESFRYRATSLIKESGATRTQPVDAAVNSGAPIFGLWTLDAPGAVGVGVNAQVAITFIADVDGQPGNVPVQAFAVGDASAGQADAKAYLVTVVGAAKLSALITVNPTSVKHGATVTYSVRLTNGGTKDARNVAVLVTLPPVLTFADSVTPFSTNGSRNKGTNPIRNTLEVFYDGFILPPLSNGSPGFVVITFRATVDPSALPGSYPVDASITDEAGNTFSLHAVAPLLVS